MYIVNMTDDLTTRIQIVPCTDEELLEQLRLLRRRALLRTPGELPSLSAKVCVQFYKIQTCTPPAGVVPSADTDQPT